MPNLIVENEAVSVDGQTVTFTFTVRNAGTNPAGASTAGVSLNDDATFDVEAAVGALTAGATEDVEVSLMGVAPGTYTSRIEADINDDVSETGEGDNTATVGPYDVDTIVDDNSGVNWNYNTEPGSAVVEVVTLPAHGHNPSLPNDGGDLFVNQSYPD